MKFLVAFFIASVALTFKVDANIIPVKNERLVRDTWALFSETKNEESVVCPNECNSDCPADCASATYGEGSTRKLSNGPTTQDVLVQLDQNNLSMAAVKTVEVGVWNIVKLIFGLIKYCLYICFGLVPQFFRNLLLGPLAIVQYIFAVIKSGFTISSAVYNKLDVFEYL